MRSRMMRARRASILLILLLTAAATGAEPVDLAKVYPATLDASDTPQGYAWTCDDNDVWQLSGFVFDVKDQIRIEVKSARVVFGRHETNALWAAIFPDEPGDLVKASTGQGEHITSLWLRFHPARVGELFPA